MYVDPIPTREMKVTRKYIGTKCSEETRKNSVDFFAEAPFLIPETEIQKIVCLNVPNDTLYIYSCYCAEHS